MQKSTAGISALGGYLKVLEIGNCGDLSGEAKGKTNKNSTLTSTLHATIYRIKKSQSKII